MDFKKVKRSDFNYERENKPPDFIYLFFFCVSILFRYHRVQSVLIQFINFWRMLYIVFEFFLQRHDDSSLLSDFCSPFDRVTVSELHAHFTCPLPWWNVVENNKLFFHKDDWRKRFECLQRMMRWGGILELIPRLIHRRRPQPENNQRQRDHTVSVAVSLKRSKSNGLGLKCDRPNQFARNTYN